MTERDDYILRKLHAEDIPAAFEMSADAGWNQTQDDWRLLLDLAPESCLAIEVGGVLAATTTLLCYGRRLAWIGMVLTQSKFQRHGFATKLLQAALKQAGDIGIETIKLDATDQGQALYEKVGFQVEQQIERWARTGKDLEESRVERLPKQPWDGSSFDVFPADRSRLLQRLAQRRPPRLIARSFLLTRPGRAANYLGPCVSDDPITSRSLIEDCVRNTTCNWYWDLFPSNQSAAFIARDSGFAPQRHLKRMYRGKRLPENENATYAIAGFELG